MSTISHPPAALPERRRRSVRLLVPELWAALAIAAMWLAVLFDAVFGPNFVSTTSSGGSTVIPSVIFVAVFAYLGTRVVAKYGFREREAGINRARVRHSPDVDRNSCGQRQESAAAGDGDATESAQSAASCGSPISSTGGSLRATHDATIRTSSTSAAGTEAAEPGRDAYNAPAVAEAVRSASSDESPSTGPQSTTRPATTQKASHSGFDGCDASTSRGRACSASSIPSVRQSSRSSRSLRRTSVPARSYACDRAAARICSSSSDRRATRASEDQKTLSAFSTCRRYALGSRSPKHGEQQRPICPYADACSRRCSRRPQWRSRNMDVSWSAISCAVRNPLIGPTLIAWPGAGSAAASSTGYSMSSRQRMNAHWSVRFSALFPVGRHSLISLFSSTSAPSSEAVGR